MTYTIENEKLICTIESLGCEIKSIKDKNTGKEYMWNADPTYWNRTSPVLFPFVGAVKEKKYRYEGKTYEMGQHGFARDMEFTLTEQTDSSIWMELTDNEESFAKYPFKFRLKIGYRMTENGVTVLWQVENRGDKDMPFAIGAHPGFMMPRDEKHVFRLYDKEGNPVESFVNRVFAGGGVVSDRNKTINTPGGILPITEHLFDSDALVIENDQIGCVELAKEGEEKAEVTVAFDAPLVGLWSPPKKNAPFVCIEPWYGRCDSESFDGELADRDHEQILNPEKEFKAAYEILFSV